MLVCLSVAALLGTLAVPPLPEAAGQTQGKKKQQAATKKAGGGKASCPMGFAPGARKPQRICD
jgi:hypothetical protein